METILRFRLREIDGRVRIRYGINDDPVRWGYELLGLGFDINVARGFPVLEARVEYPVEGYGAFMGWIQVVRYWVDDQRNPTVIVDVATQLREARMPYLSFGIAPTLFDAPAFPDQNVLWRADAFLTFAPDAVMTPVVEPACGFRWGYVVRAGQPQPTELEPVGWKEWLDIREELTGRFPDWRFQGGDRRPLSTLES